MCVPSGGAVDFSGEHRDGDVLVVSAFTNGGGVSNIDAYRWDGIDGCIDNPDEPGDCDEIPVASGGDCKAAPLLDDICATTNSGAEEENDNITTKWLTSDATLGVGNTVVPPDFFEGGINLTEVLGGASCFSTFLADTRSSQSLEATLFDFARGQLGGCESTLTTTAAGTASGSIGTGTVNSGTDTAVLTITGTQVWGGTLTWHLCGSIVTDGRLCFDRHPGRRPVTSRTVSNASPATDFVSGTATLTSAGRYCWTAHFEPNADTLAAGVDPATDNGVGECFTVAPVIPTLPTSASCSANPCVLGSILTDTATLAGTRVPARLGWAQHCLSIDQSDSRRRSGGWHHHLGALRPEQWWLHRYADDNADVTSRSPATARTRSPTRRWQPTQSGRTRSSPTTAATDRTPVAAATVTCAAPGANETCDRHRHSQQCDAAALAPE